jgi:hypothetical protein
VLYNLSMNPKPPTHEDGSDRGSIEKEVPEMSKKTSRRPLVAAQAELILQAFGPATVLAETATAEELLAAFAVSKKQLAEFLKDLLKEEAENDSANGVPVVERRVREAGIRHRLEATWGALSAKAALAAAQPELPQLPELEVDGKEAPVEPAA